MIKNANATPMLSPLTSRVRAKVESLQAGLNKTTCKPSPLTSRVGAKVKPLPRTRTSQVGASLLTSPLTSSLMFIGRKKIDGAFVSKFVSDTKQVGFADDSV